MIRAPRVFGERPPSRTSTMRSSSTVTLLPARTPGVTASMRLVLVRTRRAAVMTRSRSLDRHRLDLPQAREHLVGEESDALLGFRVGHVAGAPDQRQVTEAADLVVELHDLPVDAVGVAGEQDALSLRALDTDGRQPRRVLVRRQRGGAGPRRR